MMEMCSNYHDEIVHNEKKCPLCEALERIETFEDELTQETERANEAEAEITELENQLAELQN